MRVHYLSVIGFYVVIILLIMLLFSCKVTKHVDRQKVTVDSSVIRQNETLKRTLKETIESHEKEKQQWDSLGILFYEIIHGEPDTTTGKDVILIPATPTVEFEDGKIKKVSGPIRSVKQNSSSWEKEKGKLQSKLDSMGIELEKKDVQLSKKSEKVVKEIERVSYIPWWVWLIPIAWFGREIIPFVRKRFFKQKLNI